MGFQLGRAIGSLASGAIRTATRGLVRPTFSRPASSPLGGISPSIIATSPDSVVTTTRSGAFAGPVGFGTQTREVAYSTPSAPAAGGGGTAMMVKAGGQACASLWDGTRWRATHPNRSTYVTRGGGTSRWPHQLVVHPKGTECVVRRRINPGNGRAALRAVRRLTAFYSLSQRVAKQLRRAASKAHIRGAGRGQRRLPAGRNVEVVNVE